MSHIPDDRALDRLLESLERFNRRQGIQEEPAPKPAQDDVGTFIPRASIVQNEVATAQAVVPPELPPHVVVEVENLEDLDDLPLLTDIVLPSLQDIAPLENVALPPHQDIAAHKDIAVHQDNAVHRDTLATGFDAAPLKIGKTVPGLDTERLRDEIIQTLRTRLDIEIPTLIEAALQGALPGIIEEIRLGLEENVRAVLRDLTSSH